MPDSTEGPDESTPEPLPDTPDSDQSFETSEAYSSASRPYGETPLEDLPTTSLVPVEVAAAESAIDKPAAKGELSRKPPSPPPPSDDEDENGEDEGMLRMSFMEHLEELRTRLLRSILGLAIAFLASMFFSKDLWRIVQQPAQDALIHLGVNPPELSQLAPMEGFNIIWIKLPLLVSVFLGSPWVLYQVWAFISPGLYKRERRWAVPFILLTAGLFIFGGCFAYFVAFRYGLEFLLGIGRDVNVRPLVSISEYFDLFVNVTLGVGLVFEMPIIIFFLTLLRLASPRFLLRHSRYAILAIVVLAAIVTPTPDIFNMMIFAIPMVTLYFVGLFASFVLVMRREGKAFPWKMTILVVLGVLAVIAGLFAYFILRYHMHLIPRWPFLAK